MNRRPNRAFMALVLLPALLGALPFGLAATVAALGTSIPASAQAAGTYPVSVRWGFYVNYNPNSLQSLQANARNLNYVSPWFYNLTPDGRVTGTEQSNVNQIIKQAGALNLPMLKNSSAEYNDLTALLSDPSKVNSIVDQIDALVTANSYDGITIDFEAVNPTDKTRLTIFMSRVYDRLSPKGKLTAAVVAAKTKDINTGWAAAYDYPALGKIVDYVLVMAYDYAWANGDPGPVSPMSKLRETATYTLARIPARQVIWGAGVYGYDWAVDASGAPLGKADSRTWAEANAISLQPGAISGYDSTAQAPYTRYTLNGQNRVVWYEDRRSLEAKLELVSGRGMAGFALWRLGQEDPSIWPLVGSLPTPLPSTATVPFYQPTGSPVYNTATPVPPTRTPTPIPTPAACNPVQPFQSTATRLYFPETRHTLSGAFLKYWQQNGGLPIFGFPLTEEYNEVSKTDGKTYRVQYFERNRFEYHPENQPPNDVLLGLLGVQMLGNRLFPPAADPITGPDSLYFPQVQHTLGGAFLKYWQKKGGLRQFGFPVTEPVMEKSSINGNTYVVQYMERARFELHPEYAQSEAEVLLGLLGLDISPCR